MNVLQIEKKVEDKYFTIVDYCKLYNLDWAISKIPQIHRHAVENSRELGHPIRNVYGLYHAVENSFSSEALSFALQAVAAEAENCPPIDRYNLV